MGRFLVVATGGAGGDLQPLVAAARALGGRGHRVRFLADGSGAAFLGGLGLEVDVLPAALDLGPRLVATIARAMAATGGDAEAAGPLVQAGLGAWAKELAAEVSRAHDALEPDAVVTSLFGVEAVAEAAPRCRWAVVNSTFYVGPNPPRPIEQDFGARAVALVRRYAGLLGAPDLVLHATDPGFDFSPASLPAGHHYVGPLGVWEPPAAPPAYLEEPGDPWALVSISSQLQDDLPLAAAALAALADRPLRVLLTVGPGHRPDELAPWPANARVEQTVPHSVVLRQARLLVSHAGHGSVMKALWEGRPMVLMPWGRDQPGVAARARTLGVAEVVERGDGAAAALATAIDRVLGDSAMRAAVDAHSARLRATDPPGTAAELLGSLL